MKRLLVKGRNNKLKIESHSLKIKLLFRSYLTGEISEKHSHKLLWSTRDIRFCPQNSTFEDHQCSARPPSAPPQKPAFGGLLNYQLSILHGSWIIRARPASLDGLYCCAELPPLSSCPSSCPCRVGHQGGSELPPVSGDPSSNRT